MAGMSDEEYTRVVRELTRSKAHLARTDDWLYRLMRCNTKVCEPAPRHRVELGPRRSRILRRHAASCARPRDADQQSVDLASK